MCVEIAFGKLKARWRILRKTLDCDYKFAPKIITACCILHNLCEKSRVPAPQVVNDELDFAFPQPIVQRHGAVDDNFATDIRKAIMTHLADSYPLRRSFHV